MPPCPENVSVVFSLLLRFYPHAIREEFAEEMRVVFLERCQEEANSAWGGLMVLLHEVMDFPKALFNAHQDVIRARLKHLIHSRSMRFTPLSGLHREGSMTPREAFEIEGRRQTVLSALPPSVLGLGVMLAALIRTDVWYRLPTWQIYLSVSVVLIAGAVVGIGGLIALVRRLPEWGLTWVGSAFMGAVLTLQVTLGEGVDEGWLTLSPIMETILGLTFFLLGFLLLLWIANRGWSRTGLFTIAVAATMGLSLFQSLTAAPFNRDDIALMAGPLGLIFSLLIYLYVTQPARTRIAILVGVGLTNAGVVFIAANAWGSWLENQGTPSPLFPLLVIVTGLLLSGPLSALILDPIKRLLGGNRPVT